MLHSFANGFFHTHLFNVFNTIFKDGKIPEILICCTLKRYVNIAFLNFVFLNSYSAPASTILIPAQM